MRHGFRIVFLFLAHLAAAQFTVVTGTVTDPNGIPYSLGTITPLLISSSTPMLNAVNYIPPYQATGLDRNGKFSLNVADNTQLTPAGTKWEFHCVLGGWHRAALFRQRLNASSTEPLYLKWNTSTLNNLDNGVSGGGGSSAWHPATLGILNSFVSRVLIFQSTGVRMWIGFAGAANAIGTETYNNDAPADNFIGFRFSTSAGDTHWQCVAQTDATHHTYVDSGITPDTAAGHIFKMLVTGGGTGVQYYIDGTLVGTITTNLPASSGVFFKSLFDLNTTNGVDKQMAVSYCFWDTRL